MNKVFKMGRSSKLLSFLLIFAMLFSLLPSNIVAATVARNAAVGGTDTATGSALSLDTATGGALDFVTNTGNGFLEGSNVESIANTVDQPTVTYNYHSTDSYTDVSSEYPDDLFAVKYTNVAAWSGVTFTVTNHDYTVFDQVQIDLTPSRDGMVLGVIDQTWGHMDDSKGWMTLEEGRQTITLNAVRNITSMSFEADANADYVGTEEVTLVVHSVKFINSKAPVEPEAPAEIEVATILDVESGEFKMDDQGRLYSDTSTKLRGALDFPEDFRVEVGGVLTINYDTTISSFDAEFTYGNGGKSTYFTKTFTAGQNSLVIDMDEAWVAYFAGNDSYASNPTRARLKASSAVGYLDVISVIYTPPGFEDDGNEDDGTEDDGGSTAVYPTMAYDYASECYTNVSSEYPDDLFAVKYTNVAAWSGVTFKVTNHDYTVYDQVQIELTPSRAGMVLGIIDQSWGHMDDSKGWMTLEEGRQTITLNAVRNVTSMAFEADANADYVGTEEVTLIVHSVKFINSKAPVEPEAPAEIEVATILDVESGEFKMDDQGRLYSDTSTKLRGALDFPEDFRVEVGGVLTINYDTTISSFDAEFTYGNGGKSTYFTKTFTAGQNSLVIDMDEAWVAYFAGNDSYASNPTRARLKADSAVGYLDIISVIYTPPGAEGDDSEPVIPSWQVGNGPTVTLETSSSVFKCEVNEDKSVDVSFTAPAGWTALRAKVENSDVTKYKHVKIDITPADGLYLYVYGDAQSNSDLSGKYDFDSTERTTIEFDLPRDTTYLDLWCNPEEGDGKGTAGEKNFTIHSIKIVDPNMPEGEIIKATLFQESDDTLTKTSDNTVTGKTGDYMRCEIAFPADFRVEVGKQITIGYETNLTGVAVEQAYANADGEVWKGSLEEIDPSENTIIYTIDEAWAKFINEVPDQKWAALRLKNSSLAADGYFTLKYVVYGEVPTEQYDPKQVPQGLVVTYYDDIYSRGIAWSTDDTVEENSLYYVKATEGMTAENIDWAAETVVKVETTFKDTVDTDTEFTGITWRTFKAHVENLEPEATYFYRAGNEETGWSKVGSFTIEKAAEDIDSFSFIHVTDSQEESQAGFQKWARVLKEAYAVDPNADFVAHTGDIVNRSENKNNFHMNEWIYAFDEPMSQIMNGVFVPASGNHETLDFVFTDRFDIKWADYKEGDEELRYGGCYVVTYGEPENGLVVISLNNTAEAWDYDTDFKIYQQVWMVNQLEKYKDYKWKVVQLHEGLMTAGDHTNDGEVDTMRDTLPPIFARYNVDLVLQGHDHVYTRTRSYAYGVDIYEPGTEENPNYFDGHTPIWSQTQTLEPGETSADGNVTNNTDRTIYLEPQGTHYITINSCGTKQYPEEPADVIDEVIFEGDNPLNPTDEDGNFGSMCQPGKPMFGIVTIEGDMLIYDSYTYDNNTRTSDLYDSFAVSKKNTAGYDVNNLHEGKEEVKLYGIKMESKRYDGYAPKMDISGFVASNPCVMDVTAFKYTIISAEDEGERYNQSAKGGLFYGSNGKGIIPTERGDYLLTIEIPQNNRYFWGSTTVEFTIE